MAPLCLTEKQRGDSAQWRLVNLHSRNGIERDCQAIFVFGSA
jgi:hypothetical protein